MWTSQSAQSRELERPQSSPTKDFDLAVLLLRSLGRLLSRSYISEVVWGADAVVTSRTIDTHVSRIRLKLGLVPEYGWELKAVYAHGYRLDRAQRAALLSPTKVTNRWSAEEEV